MKSVRIRTLTFVLMALAVLLAPGMAMAIGTPAGTDVSNSAVISYTVGASPTVYDNSATPAVATFRVDFEVNFSVANQDGGNVGVVAGQSNVYQTYVVQNDSNGILGFNLQIEKVAGVPTSAGIVTYAIWVDTNENGTWDGVPNDTLYTAGDVYDINTNVGAGVTNTVFIVADILAGAAGFDTFHLVAQATDASAPASVKANSAGNGVTTEETQLAEGTGTVIFGGAADGPYNGYHSDVATFTVGSANVVFSKAVVGVVWDPVVFNSGNQKAIPGAYVEYRLTVSNLAPGTESAFLTTIVDTLDANTVLTSYWDDLSTPATPVSTIGPIVLTGCTTGVRACDGAGVTSFAGPVSNMVMTTLLPAEAPLAAGEIGVGDTVYIHYMVEIQ